MESFDALQAAIEIDNYLIGKYDAPIDDELGKFETSSEWPVPSNAALRLSEAIYDLTDPGLNKEYPELRGNEHAFREPVLKYLGEQIEKCTLFSDLAKMMERVSEDLRSYSRIERKNQERLRSFCMDLCEKLRGNTIGPIVNSLAA